jgi:small basic protein
MVSVVHVFAYFVSKIAKLAWLKFVVGGLRQKLSGKFNSCLCRASIIASLHEAKVILRSFS